MAHPEIENRATVIFGILNPLIIYKSRITPSPSPTCHALSRQILVLRLRDFKSEIMSAAAQTSASQVLSGPSQMNSPAFLSLANETPEKLAEVTRLMQILEVDLERKNLLPPSMYKYFRLEEESL